jgi:type VI secretion system protein ImpH
MAAVAWATDAAVTAAAAGAVSEAVAGTVSGKEASARPIARRSLRDLLGIQSQRGSGFSFYAALRRLECHFREQPRFGEASHPADEPVRLAQDPSLAFRAQAITALQETDPGRPPRLAVGFFGAFGPHGPLPTHLTEYVFERKYHHADGALVGFFDIFHHRLLSLLFRAWAHSQPTVSHDRPGDDRFAHWLGSLIGLTAPRAGERYTELDYACLYAASHFVGQTRNAEGLAKTLQLSFGVRARIEEFNGRWLPLPDDACWRIPGGNASHAPQSDALGLLGESTVVGSEIYDQESTFCVVLGPLGRGDYERFLPGGEHLPRLVELVERYAGRNLGWTLRLVLREPERCPAILGVEGRLSLTAHLASAEDSVRSNFEDLLIDREQLAASRAASTGSRTASTASSNVTSRGANHGH